MKLEKSEIYKANVCHIANGNTIERLSERQQKENIPAKIKERKERYVFTISPAFSVYLADDESYCSFLFCFFVFFCFVFWTDQSSLGRQNPPVGHSGGV